MKQITIRFPDDVAERLIERAEQERRTLSGMVVYLCDLGTRRPTTGTHTQPDSIYIDPHTGRVSRTTS